LDGYSDELPPNPKTQQTIAQIGFLTMVLWRALGTRNALRQRLILSGF